MERDMGRRMVCDVEKSDPVIRSLFADEAKIKKSKLAITRRVVVIRPQYRDRKDIMGLTMFFVEVLYVLKVFEFIKGFPGSHNHSSQRVWCECNR